jgi:hypothetical protein
MQCVQEHLRAGGSAAHPNPEGGMGMRPFGAAPVFARAAFGLLRATTGPDCADLSLRIDR